MVQSDILLLLILKFKVDSERNLYCFLDCEKG